ncbi:MAG: flavin reductase [Rubellimicrobium sp.]|nr:flavin reductase [Rubellimicrobium sp.]
MDDERPDPADLATAFVEAFRHHPSGAALISADPGDGPVALTAGSLISISAAPPTVAFSLSDLSSSSPAILRADTMVVHFLRAENVTLARLGATRGAARFTPATGWARLPGGDPYFPEVRTWFRACKRETLVLRGATIVVAELVAASHPAPDPAPEESSIVYLNRHWHRLRPLD